jgi:hypothetical protein
LRATAKSKAGGVQKAGGLTTCLRAFDLEMFEIQGRICSASCSFRIFSEADDSSTSFKRAFANENVQCSLKTQGILFLNDDKVVWIWQGAWKQQLSELDFMCCMLPKS